MRQNRPVRIIKRDQRARAESGATATQVEGQTQPTERELKAVVSGWVREHRQRSEELRQSLRAMFGPWEARAGSRA
jgi:hypothetical protein